MDNKKTYVKYGISTIVGFLPEIIFSWIVGKYFEVSLWYVFLGLQIVKIFIWIVRITIEYILFHLLWRRDMVDEICSSLSKGDYPNPTKYDFIYDEGSFSSVSYFSSVMNDKELDISIKLDSSQVYFLLTGMNMERGYIKSMRLVDVYTDGIKKYHQIKFNGSNYQHKPDTDMTE